MIEFPADIVINIVDWLLDVGLTLFKPNFLSIPLGAFLLPAAIVTISAYLFIRFVFDHSSLDSGGDVTARDTVSLAIIIITLMMSVVIVSALINVGTNFIYGPSYNSNEATKNEKVYKEMSKDTKRLNDFTTLYDENSSTIVKGSVAINNLLRHKDVGPILPTMDTGDGTIFETGFKIQRRQFDDEIVPLINKHADFNLNVKIGSANEDMNAQIDDVVVDKSEVASNLENADFEYTISKIEWSDAVEYITWRNVRSERNIKVIKLYLKANQTQESIDRRKLEQLKGS